MKASLCLIITILSFISLNAQNRVGMDTIAPRAGLHVGGLDGLLVSGEFNTGALIEASGEGTRLLFNPRKAAFRVGRTFGTTWDDVNVGEYSMAWGAGSVASANSSTAWGSNTNASGINSTSWGFNTIASGDGSTAWGFFLTEASGIFSTAWGGSSASGDFSTAFGSSSSATANISTAWGTEATASGIESTAWGQGTEASGQRSTAFGNSTLATGFESTAWGSNTEAKSFSETVLGAFNTNYTPTSATDWISSDRLFVIGNGTSSNSSSRSDAMVVLKNGDIGIGRSAPDNKLEVAVTSNFTPNGEGIALYNTSTNNYWNMHMSATNYRFSYNNTNVSFLNPITGSYNQTSDKRLKENITPLENKILDKLLKINAVKYNYKRDTSKSQTTGVIAQELKELFPEFVNIDEGTEYYGVNYAGLSVVAIKGIQEQQEIIEKLKTENEKLRQRVENLEKKNKEIEEKINLILSKINA